MSCVRGRAVRILFAVVEVAAYVAARDAYMAHQRDHGVGKVLADTLPGFERLIDG